MKALLEKWKEITLDYEINVTKIYGREVFHHIFDVVAHSVLTFNFKGSRVTRGWVEGLIVGDSKTGKSEVSEKLCQFLGISKPVVCEAASFSGVVGGVNESGGKRFISWGVLPRMDRRMAVLDEATGLSTDQISSMSGLRSGGIASIVKIESERALARVRKLWIANPRTDRNRRVNTYAFGVLTLPEVVGRSEDIARFDFATVAGSEEVPLEVLNAKTRKAVRAVYTAEAAKALLFWGWTRDADHIVYEKDVEDAILDLATAMCTKYSSQIPLVEPGEQRYRVARVAVALACRFHSTDKTGQQVVVKKEHVELADWFFKACYDRPYTAYDQFSAQRVVGGANLSEGDFEQIYNDLSRYKNLDVILAAVAYSDDYGRMQVVDFQKTAALLADLIRLQLLEHASDGKLQKTRRFIQFYKTLKERQAKNMLPSKPVLQEF